MYKKKWNSPNSKFGLALRSQSPGSHSSQLGTSGKTLLTSALCIALSGTLSACAGTVLRPVSESNRNTSGAYDGVWNAKTVVTRSPQTFGNGAWRSNCSDPKLDFDFQIVDAEVTLEYNDSSHKAFVDDKGRFRITLPTGQSATASTSSTRDLNSEYNYVLEGVLGERPAKGRYTVEIAAVGDGCKSSVDYKKVSGL